MWLWFTDQAERTGLLIVILCIVNHRLGWTPLRLWRISDMLVGCCCSRQMCEVLLLHPSCRERCLASGTLIVWLWNWRPLVSPEASVEFHCVLILPPFDGQTILFCLDSTIKIMVGVQLPFKLKRLVHFEHSVIPILMHWDDIKLLNCILVKHCQLCTVPVCFWEQTVLIFK